MRSRVLVPALAVVALAALGGQAIAGGRATWRTVAEPKLTDPHPCKQQPGFT